MAPMKEPTSADVTAALDALVARATHHIVGPPLAVMAIVQEVQAHAAVLRRALAAAPPPMEAICINCGRALIGLEPLAAAPPVCSCGSDNPASARHGHSHLTWCTHAATPPPPSKSVERRLAIQKPAAAPPPPEVRQKHPYRENPRALDCCAVCGDFRAEHPS